MAATVKQRTPPMPVPGGQSGLMRQLISAAFSTTDASATIGVAMKRVLFVRPFIIGQPATDEELYWADTLLDDQSFTVGDDGVITIGRVASSKTSGLPFGVEVIGY